MRHFALLPAAGTGSRLGGALPKQYLPLHGRPLLWHAVQPLCAHPAIRRVYVVLAADDVHFGQHDWSAFGDQLRVLRCGGATRARTVCNGLRAMATEVQAADWVLVHDAARPCLDAAALERLLEALRGEAVGALLALPVADTLKRADAQGRVAATQERDGLWQAQTPQAFRHGALLAALDAAGVDPTDEAGALEGSGHAPRLVRGSPANLKVTWPGDLELAAAVLQARAATA